MRSLAVALCSWVLLTACTSVEGTGEKGYVSGDGVVNQVAAAERGDAVTLTGEDLEGEPFDLADLRGDPVVVVVWGSWCTECRAEAELVTETAEELDDVAGFVGIDVRDPSVDDALAYERTFAVPFPSLYAPSGEELLAFSGTLSPNSVPAFVVLDAEGRVASSIIGRLPSQHTLVELVEDAAQESDG